ncbi:MAG: ATP-dependent dethiobiotin synthetase BioD [Alphaproteobacteria bacterium]|nr:ATP-dependent dethiobiotin synthetase BioD [Alphaproteobacteria bacterium]
MSNKCVITGTDTDIGKTVFSAMLMLALNKQASDPACYWKPVQSGVEGGVDTRTVQKLTALPNEQFIKEQYILTEPLSPHRAAELDNVEIDIDTLEIPDIPGPLLIEGAGGLNVPLTRATLFIDVFEIWDLPVILCARTGLGTINHTLLSVEALRKRKIPLHGIAFIGDDNPDNMRTIEEFSGVKILGRLPRLDALNSETLSKAFDDNFNLGDFIS